MAVTTRTPRTRRVQAPPHATRRAEAGFTLVELLSVTVIVLITLGMTAAMLTSTQRAYGAQRDRVEATHQARAAADTIARLVRMSGNNPFGMALTPLAADPDGNGAWDSIRVQADWNPADGDLADPYEDMTFTVVNGQLFKEEPADGGTPVLFADNVQSITFAYRDTNNNAIANPVASAGAIAFVTITVNTRATQFVQDGPALALRTSVAVRRAE